ncbi:MAG: TRAP transporter large permease subunit [Syntrophales bacterium]|nr:TRAP transporter large permease subunit [Syntrophales bacterium]MCU0582788.1 TRAP transporter large permease subunit [Syntrophales bacterium]
MEWWALLSLIFAALLVLIMIGIPVAFALGILSLALVLIFLGPNQLIVFSTTAFGQIDNFALVAIPLFIFMAEVILHSGVSTDAFDMLSKWTSRLPGGLAVAAQLTCTLFASVCGASTATAAAVGSIAVPEMMSRGYDKRLTCGSIAAGGALGALIPPSIYMIIYGTLVEESIGQLFMGGVIPGLMLSGMFIALIVIRCAFRPGLAPLAQEVTWADRWRSLYKVWAILFLAAAMLAAIYFGIATPSEIAGVGCFLALAIGFAYRRLTWTALKGAFLSTCRITCFIGWILVAATVFGYILSFLQLPQQLSEWLVAQSASPYLVILGINILLIFLGCIMDPAGILLVTIPILVPVIKALGFDPVWFGVMFVVNMELAQITPPLGLNLFIIKSIAPPEVTLKDILIGAWPFMVLDLVGLALVIIFPQIILWLPSTMLRG